MARRTSAESQQLTEEEFNRWEPVKAVVAFVIKVEPHTCLDTIKARIRSGSIKTAAKRFVEYDHHGDVVAERRYWKFIPGWIDHPDQRFWGVGDHTVKIRRDHTGYAGLRPSAEYEGVRLDPEGTDNLRRDLGLAPLHEAPPQLPATTARKLADPITPIRGGRETAVRVADLPGGRNNPELVAVFGPPEPDARVVDLPDGWGTAPMSQDAIDRIAEAVTKRLSKTAESMVAPAPTQQRRGPKPKPYWEAAIASVKADISGGKLRPLKQSDVEKALGAFLQKQDIYPAESTIRRHAGPIWEPFAEADNFG